VTYKAAQTSRGGTRRVVPLHDDDQHHERMRLRLRSDLPRLRPRVARGSAEAGAPADPDLERR